MGWRLVKRKALEWVEERIGCEAFSFFMVVVLILIALFLYGSPK
jgi:hypothetical protein